ncbi:hypothetical protein THAOC_13439 [Thalassiosira oceanica]|uniref:Uncharacterized protein n=1 Tax=Thalassiosira oceanica TaxID=159749 RepID=K0SHR5_THAOC|nr:hypothetical protein THAOC_13439 [Thalassiosira oceanica]|eukprot:EJK65678.1 hypothetical protein THAOC_13439 [Thalassiosira oceanica]
MGDDDDDDDVDVGSQQPGDAALLPHHIQYHTRYWRVCKIMRSRASGRQKNQRMKDAGKWEDEEVQDMSDRTRMWNDVGRPQARRCSWLEILDF